MPSDAPCVLKDAGLFYAQTPERDERLGAIGHVRMDFGSNGKEFYHSWWARDPEELNTQEFKDELGKVVDDLRKGVLKNLSSMRQHCYGSKGVHQGRLLLPKLRVYLDGAIPLEGDDGQL